ILNDDFPPPPAAPPALPVGVFPRIVRLRGRTRIDALDLVTGVSRGTLGLFRERVRVALQDVNGDGGLDVVLSFVRNGPKRNLAFDGVTLGRLFVPQPRQR